ncbi:hypothetical protein OROGR_029513 [Orobanche gracilis]
MDMVGRVLGGKFSMDDDDGMEDVSTFNNGCETNAVEVDDTDTYKNGRDTNVVEVEDESTFKSRCEANVVEVGNVSTSETGHETNVVEVEDVGTYKNGCEVNVVTDTNMWPIVIGEPSSVENSNTGRIVVEKDSDDLVPDYLVEGTDLEDDQDSLPNELVPDGTGLKWDQDSLSIELAQPGGTGLNGDQDSLSNELVPDGAFETSEVNKVQVGAFFIPKTRGEQQITEKGKYYFSDLVWGKVKSHPWWPGQIFPATAASDKAAKYFRKQSYLIAYFGDQTFAWNEESQLRPFHMYFSQMQKQSNSDEFNHAMSRALDEVTRRVEFGLSCSCLSEEVHDKIKIQVVSNAGIHEDKNIIDGGDNLSIAAFFLPEYLFEFLELVAECPRHKTDRLQFTTAKAQLLAFNRWKGHYKLPVFEGYVGLFEDDTQVNVKEEGPFPYDFSSYKRILSVRDGSIQKRKHPAGEKEFPTLKEKRISALMSCTSILSKLDEKPVKRVGRWPISSGNNSERNNYIASNSKAKRQKNMLPTSPFGEKSRKADLRKSKDPDLVEIIPLEIPTPDVIRSKLILSAKVPMQGFKIMISEVDFLRELRNLVCLENKSSFRNAEMDGGKHKAKEPANLDSANIFGLEGTKDSCWTDVVIQTYSQDQVLFQPENFNEKAVQVEESDIKEGDDVVNMDPEKPSDEHQRTALILNFTNLDSVPHVTNLNEIFHRYGPLNESETEILCKSKRAKVIFKRRADAETAFSSTGKYSIFGPSLVSYKLHYAPTPRKSRGASKRSKKDTSSKVDT